MMSFRPLTGMVRSILHTLMHVLSFRPLTGMVRFIHGCNRLLK